MKKRNVTRFKIKAEKHQKDACSKSEKTKHNRIFNIILNFPHAHTPEDQLLPRPLPTHSTIRSLEKKKGYKKRGKN